MTNCLITFLNICFKWLRKVWVLTYVNNRKQLSVMQPDGTEETINLEP
jgi:hypothetical protein